MSPITRSTADLDTALRETVEILRENIQRAQSDSKDWRVVAAALRVLAVRKGRNKPLLLDRMKAHQFPGELNLDEPGGVRKTTLEDYMHEKAGGHRTSKGFEDFTWANLVSMVAQQNGLAHVDPGLQELHEIMRSAKVHFNGDQAMIAQLHNVAVLVLGVADRFVQTL